MSTGNTLAGDTSAIEAQEPELRVLPAGIRSESRGRVIRIGINIEDVNSYLKSGFDRLVLERSIDGGVTWSEITKPSDRLVLVQDQVDYEIYDKDGDPTYRYRFRLADTRKCDGNGNPILSDPSDDIEGVGIAIQNILTPEQLKQRYFFGVDITNDDGTPLPDEVFQHYIVSAIEWMEKQLDVPILPTRFTNEPHDYYRDDYERYSFLQLDNYPLIDVEELRLQFPSGNNALVWPKSWLRLDKAKGHLRVVPTSGALSSILIGQGGSYLPAVYNNISHLPNLYEVDYIAGFEQVPRDILDLIGMFAALGPFHIFGDLIAGAGIANISLSVDGLSQSIGTTSSATNSGYGSRVLNYLKQIKEQIPHLRRFYKGVRMVVA